MASAYALARKNGGRLVVDSRVGHGSVFTFYIPMPQTVKKEVVVNDDNKASTNINPLIRDVSLRMILKNSNFQEIKAIALDFDWNSATSAIEGLGLEKSAREMIRAAS